MPWKPASSIPPSNSGGPDVCAHGHPEEHAGAGLSLRGGAGHRNNANLVGWSKLYIFQKEVNEKEI